MAKGGVGTTANVGDVLGVLRDCSVMAVGCSSYAGFTALPFGILDAVDGSGRPR